ncbi:hypothetical protein ACFFRR_005370 [Megaselia abdita]
MPGDDNYDDELVSGNPNQRNWRGILIALLVIVIVLALIVTSVVLLTPPDEGPRVKGQRLKISNIVNGDFVPEKSNGTWINDEEFIYLDHWKRISLLNISSMEDKVLMANVTFRSMAPYSFSISADKRYILMNVNRKDVYRHSSLAQYAIYDILTSEILKLKIDHHLDEWPFLQYAKFTQPGSALILIYKNDIYYTQEPRLTEIVRISNDGVPGTIYNGVPDWLYEEEVLGVDHAIWMTDDGYLMLYASFNDSLVNEHKFSWYGMDKNSWYNSDENSNRAFLYPEIKSVRFPKPGTCNPAVSLKVVDLTDLKNIRRKDVRPPSSIKNIDHYMTGAKWISPTEISTIWLNRAQNVSIISTCKSPHYNCIEIHKTTTDGRGWIDTTEVPHFSSNISSFIALSPLRDGLTGFYRHIQNVHIATKRELPITHGRYEVQTISHWDKKNNLIYFLAIPEGRPAELHLYRISSIPNLYGSHFQQPLCLTCIRRNAEPTTEAPVKLERPWYEETDENLDSESISMRDILTNKKEDIKKVQSSECLYHSVIFPESSSAKFVLINCLGPTIPTSSIYKLTLNAERPMELITVVQNNYGLRHLMSQTALPQIKTFPVVISGGYNAQVRLFLPPVLREEEITRYPTILHTYGAPGTQLVTHRWSMDWIYYLSGAKDYVVIQIDGRGSGGQGYQLLHEVYRRIGTIEVSDQLEVIEYLRDNLHFIDGQRMGVWGWSYGGYTAAMALASSQAIFQCGASVSPLATWRMYDTAYAERYLGFPNVTDNYKGYEEADLYNYVEHLRDKQFMLIQGTADDNVHLQQTMYLSKALTTKGVLYKSQIYPDEGHSLLNVRRHLWRTLSGFFDDCFKKTIQFFRTE